MLRSYFLVAFRSVRRHPLYALMNVVGLAVGLAAFVLIALYIEDELSYDGMHSDAANIYRIVEARSTPDEGDKHFAYTAGTLGPELEASLPEVTTSVRGISRFASGRRVVERGDTRLYVGDQLFTEPAFFELLDFPFLVGNRDGALDEPLEVVLTTESARTFFGQEDPTGKTLTMEGVGDLTVRGVVDVPENTHIGYSLFVSFETLLQFEGWRNFLGSWGSSAVMTYVALDPSADPSAVQAKMQQLFRNRVDAEDAVARSPYLQPIRDIHLRSAHIEFDENRAPGRMVYLYLFGAVAVCVVLIAAMNYMNMATARSMRRAREVGMRKVVGARRNQLVAQFLAESVITTLVALGVSGGMVVAALPAFNQLANKSIELDLAAHWPVALVILGGATVVGIVAGAYPAFFLSKFRPSTVLRGSGATRAGRSPVWKGVVVTQFALSITLIVATLVVSSQLEFIQTKKLGFDEQQLVVVDINDGAVRSQFDVVKEEFARVPGVQSVSVSNNVPGDWKPIPQVEVARTGSRELVTGHFLGVDETFLTTYEIQLTDGRGFSGRLGSDSTSVLLNQTAAALLKAGIGDQVHIPEDEYEATVIGIVEDFHFASLHNQIGPMLLGYRSNPIDVIDYFSIRFDAANLAGTLQGLRSVGERFDPEHPFEYNFLDERLADFYTSEERVRRIFGAAAALAIIIACLGLFGLAAYSAEQRTKEIGIRKTLGATAASIVALMTTDFARLVAIAFVFAAPISYLAMGFWLRDFAYRTSVELTTLLLAGAAALFLAVLTVGFQALRAAMTDPVDSLRHE